MGRPSKCLLSVKLLELSCMLQFHMCFTWEYTWWWNFNLTQWQQIAEIWADCSLFTKTSNQRLRSMGWNDILRLDAWWCESLNIAEKELSRFVLLLSEQLPCSYFCILWGFCSQYKSTQRCSSDHPSINQHNLQPYASPKAQLFDMDNYVDSDFEAGSWGSLPCIYWEHLRTQQLYWRR